MQELYEAFLSSLDIVPVRMIRNIDLDLRLNKFVPATVSRLLKEVETDVIREMIHACNGIEYSFHLDQTLATSGGDQPKVLPTDVFCSIQMQPKTLPTIE